MAPSTERGSGIEPWTLPDLQVAIAAAFGSRRSGYPNVDPVAAALGVSPRSVHRWLSGQNQPAVGRRSALRHLLLPEAAVLRRQERDADVARIALTAMSARRAKKATAHWRRQGWGEKHLVRMLYNERRQICCVTLHLVDRVKAPSLPGSWRDIEALTVPSRPLGVLVRSSLLDAVADFRIRVDPAFCPVPTMCWLASAPRPSLIDVVKASDVLQELMGL